MTDATGCNTLLTDMDSHKAVKVNNQILKALHLNKQSQMEEMISITRLHI